MAPAARVTEPPSPEQRPRPESRTHQSPAASRCAAARARRRRGRGEDARGGEAREKRASPGDARRNPAAAAAAEGTSRPPSAVEAGAALDGRAARVSRGAAGGGHGVRRDAALGRRARRRRQRRRRKRNALSWLGVPGSVDRVALTSPRGAPECVTLTRLDVFAGRASIPRVRSRGTSRCPVRLGNDHVVRDGRASAARRGIAGRRSTTPTTTPTPRASAVFAARVSTSALTRVAHHGSCSGSAGSANNAWCASCSGRNRGKTRGVEKRAATDRHGAPARGDWAARGGGVAIEFRRASRSRAPPRGRRREPRARRYSSRRRLRRDDREPRLTRPRRPTRLSRDRNAGGPRAPQARTHARGGALIRPNRNANENRKRPVLTARLALE